MLRFIFLGVAQIVLLSYHTVSVFALPTPNDGVVRLPLRREVSDHSRAPLQSRRDVTTSLKNGQIWYLIDLKVGSNNQPVTLQLDTGSTNTWAYSVATCRQAQCQGNSYDPATSKSKKEDKKPDTFDDSYLDGANVKGYFLKDDIMLGASKIDDVHIGVATEYSKYTGRYGILGLGLKDGYTTFLESLKKSKLIKSLSYGIHLDRLGASGGSIHFGGTDSTKYTGSLVYNNIVAPSAADRTPRLQIWWNSLVVNDPKAGTSTLRTETVSVPAFLDTGSTLSTLPYKEFYTIYQYLGGDINAKPDQYGRFSISCNPPHRDNSISFGMGTGTTRKTISVPVSEFILPGQSSGQCHLGIRPSTGSFQTFGDTFLRSVYMHVDLDKDTIGLAQSRWS